MSDENKPPEKGTTQELVWVPSDIERDELGRIKPGQTLNPGGRPAALRDLAESIRSRSPELIARLFEIALKGKPGNPTTVRAAEVLLERGYGKAPIQLQDEDGNKLRAAVIILPGDKGDDE